MLTKSKEPSWEGFRFSYRDEQSGKIITMSLHPHQTLTDLAEELSAFVRAVGYSGSHFEVVGDDEVEDWTLARRIQDEQDKEVVDETLPSV